MNIEEEIINLRSDIISVFKILDIVCQNLKIGFTRQDIENFNIQAMEILKKKFPEMNITRKEEKIIEEVKNENK